MGYWEDRYRKGGTSGEGSIGEYRKWKWEIIDKYAKSINDVIDVGCGDLSFWEGRNFPNHYTGIDISQTIIERNRKARPNLTFLCSSAEDYLNIGTARIVFCLDVLFHIMEDSVYEKVLSNLTRYSSDWIFIFTWSKNPSSTFQTRPSVAKNNMLQGRIKSALAHICDNSSDGIFQKYRRFDAYFAIFEKAGFELKAVEQNEQVSKYGSMYVFEKSGTGRQKNGRGEIQHEEKKSKSKRVVRETDPAAFSLAPKSIEEGVGSAYWDQVIGRAALNRTEPNHIGFELPSKAEGVSNLEFLRLLTPYVYAAPLASRKVILDVACGRGHGSLWLAKGANQLAALDTDKAKIRQLSKWSASTQHLDVSIMDAQRLGFRSRTFQVVTCFEVIEHLSDPDILLSELRRVLTEDGCLLLTTPNRTVRLLPLQAPWNHEHLREYSRRNLQRSLRRHFPNVKLLGIYGEREAYAYYRRIWNSASLTASPSRLSKIMCSLLSATNRARRVQRTTTGSCKYLRSETDLVNMEIPNPNRKEWPFYVGETNKQCLNFFAICGLNSQAVQRTADVVEYEEK